MVAILELVTGWGVRRAGDGDVGDVGLVFFSFLAVLFSRALGLTSGSCSFGGWQGEARGGLELEWWQLEKLEWLGLGLELQGTSRVGRSGYGEWLGHRLLVLTHVVHLLLVRWWGDHFLLASSGSVVVYMTVMALAAGSLVLVVALLRESRRSVFGLLVVLHKLLVEVVGTFLTIVLLLLLLFLWLLLVTTLSRRWRMSEVRGMRVVGTTVLMHLGILGAAADAATSIRSWVLFVVVFGHWRWVALLLLLLLLLILLLLLVLLALVIFLFLRFLGLVLLIRGFGRSPVALLTVRVFIAIMPHLMLLWFKRMQFCARVANVLVEGERSECWTAGWLDRNWYLFLVWHEHFHGVRNVLFNFDLDGHWDFFLYLNWIRDFFLNWVRNWFRDLVRNLYLLKKMIETIDYEIWKLRLKFEIYSQSLQKRLSFFFKYILTS